MASASFRAAVREASNQAAVAGTITKEQQQQIHQVVADSSTTQAGLLQGFVGHLLSLGGNLGSIDWSALIAAITNLMPLILQIIALFKAPVPPAAVTAKPATIPTTAAPPQGAENPST